MSKSSKPVSVRSSAPLGISPMEQLIAFVDWERKNNPGHKHVAEWALEELQRFRELAARALPANYDEDPDTLALALACGMPAKPAGHGFNSGDLIAAMFRDGAGS